MLITPAFIPHPLLTGPHRMTLIPRWIPRPHLLKNVPGTDRRFWVDSDSQIAAKCHWQKHANQHPTLLIIHGLEGCIDSHYMMGIAHKAWHSGINVVRLNQRNCGGTEHLTPTLYHTGMSNDLRAIMTELIHHDQLSSLWIAGFSMGGNLTLKLAGEIGATIPEIHGVVGVCPNIHPAACVEALQQPGNVIYHHYFLPRLKARLRRKAQHFPGRWDLSKLSNIRSMRQFDDVFTAPDAGYRNAEEYYEQCGARHVLHNIRIPTLIVTSRDDPFIPYETFRIDGIQSNPYIQFIATDTGGHCGFLQQSRPSEDYFWIENRIIQFVLAGARSKTL
ncbi:MAG: alpha/beta hydrolase [Nitrospirales bacterium]|nr:MAG: alpha/beta hydrolase [Nitrospirales bacterium]